MPERTRIMIGTAHHRDMEPEYVLSVYKATIILNKIGVTCDYVPMEGAIISGQRNSLVEKCLEGEAKYLLFVDADSSFEPLTLTEMLDANKDIIGCLYRMRGLPFLPIAYQIVPEKGDGYFRRLNFEEIQPEPFVCGAVGAGLMMIKRHVLEKMMGAAFIKTYGYPFNLWQRPDGVQLGEDMSFSMRARIAGFETWCYPSQTMAHIGNIAVMNNAVLTPVFPHYSNDIEGWMTANELNWLYNTAKRMDSIVEIGSWKGRSTLALLNGCPGNVYAVDTFKGSRDEIDGAHREAVNGDVYKVFCRNTGKFKNLKTLVATSEEAAGKVGNVDMIFIDGSHAYEDVKQDIEIWRPKVRKVICGHDLNWPSVAKAVEEMFEGYERRRASDSIWYFEL